MVYVSKTLREYLHGKVIRYGQDGMMVMYFLNQDTLIVEFRQTNFGRPTWRSLNHYSPEKKLIEIIQQFWETDAQNSYGNVTQTIKLYDANGFNIKDSINTWSNNSWAPSARTTYTVNAKGYLLFQQTQNYSNGQWINGNQRTFTRDSAGNALTMKYEFWSAGAWVNGTYDSSIFSGNKVVEFISKRFSSNVWNYNNRRTYTYDANGDNELINYYYWSGTNWTFSYRDLFATQPEKNIVLLYPNQGTFYSTDTIVVVWKSSGISSVNIHLSTDNGSSWSLLAGNVPDSSIGFYKYWNTTINSSNCLMKVTDAVSGIVTDQTGTPFTLYSTPAMLTHETGTVSLSVFTQGYLGYDSDGSYGIGFTYDGKINPLFTAGLMVAAAPVSNAGLFGTMRSFGINDLQQSEPLSGFTSNEYFNQITNATYTLPNGPYPLNQLVIRQKSQSRTGDDNVIIVYKVNNPTNNTISGIHVGLFADWDIGSPTADLGGIIPAQRLVYQYEQNGINDSHFYGLVSLSKFSGGKVTTLGNVRTNEGWTWISTVDPDSVTSTGDHRSFIGSGPFEIPSQSLIQAGFAFVGASSFLELISKAEVLIQTWGNGSLRVGENGSAQVTTFVLSQNYPNPFNPSTVIRYFLPENSKVSLKVYDLLGREVASLVNEEQIAGWKEVQWNARLASAGSASVGQAFHFASGMYLLSMSAGSFVSTKKMTLIK